MIDQSGISGTDRHTKALALTPSRGRASVMQVPPQIIEADYAGRVHGYSHRVGSTAFQAQMIAQQPSAAHGHSRDAAGDGGATDTTRHAVIAYAIAAEPQRNDRIVDLQV